MGRYFDNIYLDRPHYTVPVASLTQSYDLKTFCNLHKITDGLYGFELLNINKKPRKDMLFGGKERDQDIINIGMSNDIGERIYRKTLYIPGWGSEPTGYSGVDMKNKVIPLTEKHYEFLPNNIHKDDFLIHIWDVGVLGQANFANPAAEAEKELIDQYVNKFGRKPIGNVQDPRKRNSKNRQTPTYAFNKLFTVL